MSVAMIDDVLGESFSFGRYLPSYDADGQVVVGVSFSICHDRGTQ